jgi:hypothetical protein
MVFSPAHDNFYPHSRATLYIRHKEERMPEELDPAVAHDLSNGAMASLSLTPGNKVVCTKPQLHECLSTLAQEAYAIGFLAGQKEQFGSLVSAGTAERPAWMDIPLEDTNSLTRHGIRLRPVALRSLIGAGYRVLGDLCWASDHELRRLFYIGSITARQIRTEMRQFQAPISEIYFEHAARLAP